MNTPQTDYPFEDDLFSISAVAVADPHDETDMASDHSDWVRQYTDWEDTERTSR